MWVIVHVQDENDNPPTFPEVTYRVSLTERDRNKRGDPVYRVFAYDRDLGANSNITYSIVDGNEDEKFTIDPRTAMVSSKKMVTAGSSDILTVSLHFVGFEPKVSYTLGKRQCDANIQMIQQQIFFLCTLSGTRIRMENPDIQKSLFCL